MAREVPKGISSPGEPLNCVSKAGYQGTKVVFCDGGSIVNAWWGHGTVVSKERGVCMLHTWVPSVGFELGQVGCGQAGHVATW